MRNSQRRRVLWEFFRARDVEGRSRGHLDRVAPAPPSPMGERLEVARHRERVEDASFRGTDREFFGNQGRASFNRCRGALKPHKALALDGRITLKKHWLRQSHGRPRVWDVHNRCAADLGQRAIATPTGDILSELLRHSPPHHQGPTTDASLHVRVGFWITLQIKAASLRWLLCDTSRAQPPSSTVLVLIGHQVLTPSLLGTLCWCLRQGRPVSVPPAFTWASDFLPSP